MCGGGLGVFVGCCVALLFFRGRRSCQHQANILALPLKEHLNDPVCDTNDPTQANSVLGNREKIEEM